MLTNRQREVLQYLREYQAARGKPPTVREIQAGRAKQVFRRIAELATQKYDCPSVGHGPMLREIERLARAELE